MIVHEEEAHNLFLKQVERLPLNTQRAYVRVTLQDCAIYMPCKYVDNEMMDKVKNAYQSLCNAAKY